MRVIRTRWLRARQRRITRTYSFGGSQSGEYQREFVYLGFNEDEAHRKVLDALWVHKSGTHRLFANVEFADPNTYALQDDRHDFLGTSYPPFTFAVHDRSHLEDSRRSVEASMRPIRSSSRPTPKASSGR